MSHSEPTPSRTPLTDSPWYWLYLFATAALVALVLMGPKYAARQSQLERNLQGRQRAAQQRVGEEPTTPMSSETRTLIRLEPLYAVMAGLLLIGWIGLFLRHRRAKQLAAPMPRAAEEDIHGTRTR